MSLSSRKMDSEVSPKRLPQLDFLRAIAILLVLASHPTIDPKAAGVWQPLSNLLSRIGWTGVELFFVLSGFLIGGLLFAEIRITGHLDAWRFMIRRAFKIWPSYYFFIVVISLGVWYTNANHPVLPYYFHIQNYRVLAEDQRGDIAFQTWSLAVEEHFYFLLPLVLLAFKKHLSSRTVMMGFVVLTFTCCAFRLGTMNSNPEVPEARTHLRIDSLGFGVVLAYVYQYHRRLFDRVARYRWSLVIVGCVLVYVAADRYAHNHPWGRTLKTVAIYLGYGAILLAVVNMPFRWYTSRLMRGFLTFGLFSYPIYLWHIDGAYKVTYELWHQPATLALNDSLRWVLGMSSYVLLSTFLGIVMSRLIELPTLATRDRLFPAKAVVVGTIVNVEETSNIPEAVASDPSPCPSVA